MSSLFVPLSVTLSVSQQDLRIIFLNQVQLIKLFHLQQTWEVQLVVSDPWRPKSHSNLALSLFFRTIGRRLSRANTTRSRTVSTVMGSMVEVSCWSVVPAWMNIKEGGATPKKVPTQKGRRGTPITGETILMNLREKAAWKHWTREYCQAHQLGRKGVIRRKRM